MSISEEFIEAFNTNTNGNIEFCDCGKIHFHDSQQWDWELGELERLRSSAKEDDDYVVHYEDITNISFGGGHMVVGCQCNGAGDVGNFEDVISKDARSIARYLKLIFKKEKEYLETIKDFNEL